VQGPGVPTLRPSDGPAHEHACVDGVARHV
jgi:hypothetical protein